MLTPGFLVVLDHSAEISNPVLLYPARKSSVLIKLVGLNMDLMNAAIEKRWIANPKVFSKSHSSIFQSQGIWLSVFLCFLFSSFFLHFSFLCFFFHSLFLCSFISLFLSFFLAFFLSSLLNFFLSFLSFLLRFFPLSFPPTSKRI